MKILIADDDRLMREMLQSLLVEAGYEVAVAADGQEARRILDEERCRMLIVDWMMPGLDGPGLIRHVRTAGSSHYTYIILLSAKNGRDEIVAGLNEGADDYVTKPYRREELLARLGVGTRILDLEARLNASLAREEMLATRDGLTGLLNRRALDERASLELTRATREKRSVGVILMDLDHFKQINDRFGHGAGDEALRRVGEVLEQGQRNYDLKARWGGEEFLLVLPGASLSQSCMVAERVRTAVESIELRLDGGAPVRLRASFGVACASGDAPPVSLEEILERADRALYRAKAEGRNRVCYHPLAA